MLLKLRDQETDPVSGSTISNWYLPRSVSSIGCNMFPVQGGDSMITWSRLNISDSLLPEW